MGRASSTRGLTLDAGALIGLDRGDPRVRQLIRVVSDAGGRVDVPTTVVAQAWRDGSRQANLALFLKSHQVREIPFDSSVARETGLVCGRCGHPDVVDVHVVTHALRNDHVVLTSDPKDLRRVDPGVRLVEI